MPLAATLSEPNSAGIRTLPTPAIHRIFQASGLATINIRLKRQCPGSDCRGISAMNQELAFWYAS